MGLSLTGRGAAWEFFDYPTNLWERILRRPNIAIIGAALQAVGRASRKQARLLITQEPRTTFLCRLFSRLLRKEISHYVFSFNVATNSVCIYDYLISGYNGVLCDPHSPDSLTETIAKLWTDPGEITRLANNNHNFGAENCTEDRIRFDLAEVQASCQHRLVRRLRSGRSSSGRQTLKLITEGQAGHLDQNSGA